MVFFSGVNFGSIATMDMEIESGRFVLFWAGIIHSNIRNHIYPNSLSYSRRSENHHSDWAMAPPTVNLPMYWQFLTI